MNQNQPIRELPLLEITNVETVYRTNFAGVARPPFDDEGDHYFNVKLNPADADALARDGWPVKMTKPAKDAPPEVVAEFVPEPYIVVNIGFKFRPPTIILIKVIDGVERPTIINEKTIATLDSAEFTKIDIVARARYWEGPQGSGYKVWLAEFYGHVNTTNLGNKYAYLLEGPVSSDETTD